ncbi:MAG: CapA family protein [Clostridia bacterium]|nr:CapA family protein [Clostridia bacterium]
MGNRLTKILLIILLTTGIISSCSYFDMTEKPTVEPKPTATPSPLPSLENPTSPPPSPTAAVQPSEEPKFQSVEFTIIAAGDVMAHGDNLKSAYDASTDTYSFEENYIHVKKIIEQADLALCNLETVTAGKEAGYTSYPLFNTPASIIDGLKYAGFDVIVTANNHSLDRGETGIVKTLGEIEQRGILATGTYMEKGNNYLTVDIKGFSISILAYTQHLNGNLPLLPEDKHFMINRMDKEQMINDIERASLHSDLVIVYLHWGNEYTRGTEEWQPSYAYDLIEAGADAILGTHPHVVRPDEIVMRGNEPKYIIYSMGNFISNFLRTDNKVNAIYTEDGVMVSLRFKSSEDGSIHLTNVTPIPTWPYKYANETGIHYEIIPVEDISKRLHENDYANSEAADSYNRTMESLEGFSGR